MKKIINPAIIIFIAAILRLVPHPANVAPIAAMALFGGVYLNKKYALIVPLVAMFVSDIFLGFHNTMIFVYGSFLLSGLIGIWLKTHKAVINVISASLISSVLFFLITNAGVWIMGSYDRAISGLFQSYVAGIPFFRNTILGDLFYTGVLFGSYELILRLLKSPRKVAVK